jgi:uncharacterized OsmC-like protein
VIRRIHVRYTLRVGVDAVRDAIARCHRLHADRCPVARSIRDAIDISTELDVVGPEG